MASPRCIITFGSRGHTPRGNRKKVHSHVLDSSPSLALQHQCTCKEPKELFSPTRVQYFDWETVLAFRHDSKFLISLLSISQVDKGRNDMCVTRHSWGDIAGRGRTQRSSRDNAVGKTSRTLVLISKLLKHLWSGKSPVLSMSPSCNSGVPCQLAIRQLPICTSLF